MVETTTAGTRGKGGRQARLVAPLFLLYQGLFRAPSCYKFEYSLYVRQGVKFQYVTGRTFEGLSGGSVHQTRYYWGENDLI